MFNLEKRRFQGGLITGFQYLRGVYKISGEVIFIREYSYRTRGKSFKLKKKKKIPSVCTHRHKGLQPATCECGHATAHVAAVGHGRCPRPAALMLSISA